MNKLMPKECKAGQEISVCAEGLGLFQDPGTWIFISWGKEGLGLWPLLGFFPSVLYFEFYYSGSDHFWCCISRHNKKQFFFSPYQPRGRRIPCLSGGEKMRPHFSQSPQAPQEPGFSAAKTDKITAEQPWCLVPGL